MENRGNRTVLWVVIGVLAVGVICLSAVLVGGAAAFLFASRVGDGPNVFPTAELVPEFRAPVLPERTVPVVPMPMMESVAVVTAVTPGSPADEAGIEVDDIILRFGGEALSSGVGPADLIADYEPGDTVTVTVMRDADRRTLRVTLGEHPDDPDMPWMGITYQLVRVGPGMYPEQEN